MSAGVVCVDDSWIVCVGLVVVLVQFLVFVLVICWCFGFSLPVLRRLIVLRERLCCLCLRFLVCLCVGVVFVRCVCVVFVCVVVVS